MINTWKYLSKGYDVEEANLFTRATTESTRGHSKKIYKLRFATRLRGCFFSQSVISLCNNLPQEVVGTTTVNSFKNALDRAWKDKEFLYMYEAVDLIIAASFE